MTPTRQRAAVALAEEWIECISGEGPATPGPTGATVNETPPDGLPALAASPVAPETGLRAALERIVANHWEDDGLCDDCHWPWPCSTYATARAALTDAPAEEETR